MSLWAAALLPVAGGHDWPELGAWAPDAHDLAEAVLVAERLQAARLDAAATGAAAPPPALAPASSAFDWWRWLTDVIDLGDRDARAGVRDEVIAAGYDHDPALAVDWWEATMESLVVAVELLRAAPVDRAALEAVVARAAGDDPDSEAEAAHAARLLTALDRVGDPAAFEPLRPRVEAMIDAAVAGR